MAPVLMHRSGIVGLAIGSLWLIAISEAFAILSLLLIGTPVATAVLLGVAAVGLGLIAVSVGVIRAALGLPKSPASSTDEGRRIRRQFATAVGGEIVALAVVNTVCLATGRQVFIVPFDLLIVGVHFLPLARIFRVPRYYVLGAFFCLVPLVTVMAIPSTARVGQALAWLVVPSLACALWASLTGAIGLREAWQAVRTARAIAPTPPAA